MFNFYFIERGDSFDWEELVDKRTEELRTVFDEHLSGKNEKIYIYMNSDWRIFFF